MPSPKDTKGPVVKTGADHGAEQKPEQGWTVAPQAERCRKEP